MKRAILSIVFCLVFGYCNAQKYACFDSEYVLSKIPDYQQAQKRLDQYAVDWQKELEAKQQELESLRNAYQQEAYLLPENLKRRRQEDLKTKEQEVKTLQYQYFGVGGDLDKKRAELIKPVQDRVYNALSRLASEKGYAFIFDKAGNSSLAYVNAKYDVSSQVLEMLGVTAESGKQQADSNVDSPKGSSGKGTGKEPSDIKKTPIREKDNKPGVNKMKR
ncbi:MAG: OmpH family outer membrane protein [Bacteroidales bacterium]|nr:OmpH family outer membrane protein [Bacteroidales bacterium]